MCGVQPRRRKRGVVPDVLDVPHQVPLLQLATESNWGALRPRAVGLLSTRDHDSASVRCASSRGASAALMLAEHAFCSTLHLLVVGHRAAEVRANDPVRSHRLLTRVPVHRHALDHLCARNCVAEHATCSDDDRVGTAATSTATCPAPPGAKPEGAKPFRQPRRPCTAGRHCAPESRGRG